MINQKQKNIMKKLIIISMLIGLLYSCKDDAKIKNPKVDLANFTLTAIKYESSYVTLVIINKKGKEFAYAEKSQTQSGMIPYSQIRFPKTSCDTITTLVGNGICLYEFTNDEYGQLMLKDAGYVPYIQSSFQIN